MVQFDPFRASQASKLNFGSQQNVQGNNLRRMQEDAGTQFAGQQGAQRSPFAPQFAGQTPGTQGPGTVNGVSATPNAAGTQFGLNRPAPAQNLGGYFDAMA